LPVRRVARRLPDGANSLSWSAGLSMQGMPTFFSVHGLLREREPGNRPYLEFLRVPAMSCGIYVLAPGAVDKQMPHKEDELYYVLRGLAHMTVRNETTQEDREVKAGDMIFVKAGQEHRFHSITEELAVLVFFAPAET
jgi:mannose-6-phosphate isomerase-like protein (cupin superfamily)